MRKLLSLLLLAAILGTAGWFAWNRIHTMDPSEDVSPPRESPPPPPEVETIRRGTICDLRVFPGTIMPRPQHVIAPKVAGRLKAVVVSLGQAVQPGDIVAQVTDNDLRQQVELAESTLTVAKLSVELQRLSLNLAERKRERIRQLWEQHVASEMSWDDADANYTIQAAQHKMSIARMTEAELQLRWAEGRLADANISVPLDIGDGAWFVSDIKAEVGAMMAVNMPLVAVVDLSRVIGVIHVSEQDYSTLHLGQAVSLGVDALPGVDFAGNILSIAPALQESTRPALRDEARLARIEIEIPNLQFRLRPGMAMQVRITFSQQEDATLLPRSALIDRDGKTGILWVDPTTRLVRFVPVTPDVQTADTVSIRETDLTGEVVTSGHDQLSDGAPLPQRVPPPPAITDTPPDTP
jgi:RND family efflux transporter MFP subunit